MQQDLIRQLKAGHEKAFQELVEAHKDRVLNTCFHFVQNRLDAEDLSQEVFIEVHRSIHQFREDAQLSTWIYRIAVNKSLDTIRKKKRKKRFAYVRSLFGASDQAEDLPLPAPDNPENDLEQMERKLLLNKAIGILPENQKVAITLGQLQGFTNKEIATILETSVSAVEALIFRAKKNLHKKLYHYYNKNL